MSRELSFWDTSEPELCKQEVNMPLSVYLGKELIIINHANPSPNTIQAQTITNNKQEIIPYKPPFY